MDDIKDWIKNHEGCHLKPYTDTAGKLTIGYGRNLQDNGISKKEADLLFENDFQDCIKEFSQYMWYINQPRHIQYALLDMCFNLGIEKLLGFKKMIKALEEKNYTTAALEVLNSEWAIQVKNRAKDVSILIREGME